MSKIHFCFDVILSLSLLQCVCIWQREFVNFLFFRTTFDLEAAHVVIYWHTQQSPALKLMLVSRVFRAYFALKSNI